MNWNNFIEKLTERYNGFLEAYKKESDFEEKWHIHLHLIELETIIMMLQDQMKAMSDTKIFLKIGQLYYNLSIERLKAERLNPLIKSISLITNLEGSK